MRIHMTKLKGCMACYQQDHDWHVAGALPKDMDVQQCVASASTGVYTHDTFQCADVTILYNALMMFYIMLQLRV
jgi:hypothetical protein